MLSKILVSISLSIIQKDKKDNQHFLENIKVEMN